MATTVTFVAIERSGPAIRASLNEHYPEDGVRFETEFRGAMARAADNFDLTDPQTVLTRWHALATMAANPLTDEERKQVDRAKAGNFTGMYSRDETGTWLRL